MRNWLRSEFGGRFSLSRLVVATVFLGAFVGLNMQRIGPTRLASGIHYYYGWPLPFIAKGDEREYYPPFEAPENCEALLKEHNAFMDDYNAYRIPFHHQIYCLLRRDSLRNLDSEKGRILCVVINILFAVVVLALILLLQPPRRKAPNSGLMECGKACPKCGSTKTKPTFYAQGTMGINLFAMIRGFFCESYFICSECDCVFDDWGKICGKGKWSWAYGLLALLILTLIVAIAMALLL